MTLHVQLELFVIGDKGLVRVVAAPPKSVVEFPTSSSRFQRHHLMRVCRSKIGFVEVFGFEDPTMTNWSLSSVVEFLTLIFVWYIRVSWLQRVD